MKKKLLLVTAAAMLLVGCNNNAGNDSYLAEPETKSEIQKDEAAKKLTASSASVKTAKAIGAKVVGYAELGATITSPDMTEEETSASESKKLTNTISFKANDLNATMAFSGLGTGPLAGSIAIGGTFSGNYNGTKIVANEDWTSIGTEPFSAKLEETKLDEKVYLEDGVAYADFNNSMKNLTAFISNIGEGMGLSMKGLDLEELNGKYKTAVPAEALAQLSTFNLTLSSLLDQFVVTITSDAAKDILPTLLSVSLSTPKSVSDYFTFKEYKDGTFGVTMNLDLAKFIKETGPLFGETGPLDGETGPLDGETGPLPMNMLNGLTGNLQAVVNFSDKGLLSVGAEMTLGLASNMEALGTSFDVSVKSGFKTTFSYGDDVKVEKVTDKESYKDLPTPAEDDGETDPLD